MVTELAKIIAGTSNTQTSLKRSTVKKSAVQNKFQIGQSSVNIIELPEIRETRLIYSGGNDSFVLGHSTNGVLGVANGVGGSQIVLGDYRTSYSVERIVNPNNTWRWLLSSLENSYWVDTGNTTCTVTAGSSISFALGEVLQTNRLAIEDISVYISSASLVINEDNITNSGNLTFYLSANDGANWESVALNSGQSFTNTGRFLKLRIVASGNATISLKDSDGIRSPIEIPYNITGGTGDWLYIQAL
jgi:hypothetical protein